MFWDCPEGLTKASGAMPKCGTHSPITCELTGKGVDANGVWMSGTVVPGGWAALATS